MITTQKASDVSSPITAHRVFLLHLESMRLLGEDNRCNGQSQKKSETKEARLWRSGALSLGKTVLLLAALIAASVIWARAQSTMGSILGTEQDASSVVLNHTNFALSGNADRQYGDLRRAQPFADRGGCGQPDRAAGAADGRLNSRDQGTGAQGSGISLRPGPFLFAARERQSSPRRCRGCKGWAKIFITEDTKDTRKRKLVRRSHDFDLFFICGGGTLLRELSR